MIVGDLEDHKISSVQNFRSVQNFMPLGTVESYNYYNGVRELGTGVHKIFFGWYPTFSPKNLSYEMRDCYYQKMREKRRYEMEYIT